MDRETCADCGKEAPQTETNYTLISAQFGWRLTRSKTPEGELLVEWRCPTCWREHKKLRPGAITGNGIHESRSTVPPPGPTTPVRTAVKSVPPGASGSSPHALPAPPRPPAPAQPAAPAKRPSVPARKRPT